MERFQLWAATLLAIVLLIVLAGFGGSAVSAQTDCPDTDNTANVESCSGGDDDNWSGKGGG
ncbi:hypothetical protein ACFLYO_06520 [Chloroflexota bacterium]